MPDRISVVTVCRNPGPDVLERTIRSVLSQRYDNLEYIIIDGGSTDGSVDVIRHYAPRLAHWVSEPDGGIFPAMTKGIEAATGRYVNFMNAGDLFFNDYVLADVFGSQDYSEDVVYGRNLIRYPGGYKASPVGDPSSLLGGIMPFCHQNAFTSPQVLREFPFDPSFRIIADLDQYRRMYLAGVRFRKVDKYISIYDSRGVSSGASLELYAEHCRLTGERPTLRSYLSRYATHLFAPVRYGSLRFHIMSRRKPQKYALTPGSIRQL
ncbi:MAG: glycosyltransferase [Duncaniella sp.]|nr:glycosyltransferase [Duncaniella sp.]